MISIPLTTTHLLPIEVWERTIDWLVIGYTPKGGQTYRGNLNLRRDLSSCARVCRAWRVRTQTHLFALLRISGNGLSQYEHILLKSPSLGRFAKELLFYSQYIEDSRSKTSHKTIETASHAVRIAHKLSSLQHLALDFINLAVEHPRLPSHIAALTAITRLHFHSPTPTKLSQLTRVLVGLKGLSSLYLSVPIVVDLNPVPLPTPCYTTKSSLTRLDFIVHPGGHLLLDWLVRATSFTTCLKTLAIWIGSQLPQLEIAPVIQGVQALLDNCTRSLEEWYFHTKIQVEDPPSMPKGKQ